MKNKNLFAPFSLAGALVLAAVIAQPAFARQQEKEDEKPAAARGKDWPPSAPKTTISPVQAMAVAKKKVGGGLAFQANFEFDEGQWVYGVMVVKGHKIWEVEINPVSGKALDSEQVTPSDEAKEMTDTLKKIAAMGG